MAIEQYCQHVATVWSARPTGDMALFTTPDRETNKVIFDEYKEARNREGETTGSETTEVQPSFLYFK